jgi:hypothetical protein
MSKKIGFKRGQKTYSREEGLKAVLAKSNSKTESIPSELRPYQEFFDLLPKPVHRDDWLAQYVETEQSFARWFREFGQRAEQLKDKKIYLRMMYVSGEDTRKQEDEMLEKIKEFVSIYYLGLEVEILPAISMDKSGSSFSITYEKRTRGGNKTKKIRQLAWRKCHPWYEHEITPKNRQFEVGSLLDTLYDLKPKDAFAVIGLTNEDLYAGRSDHFTAGMAAGGSGVAVFSLARYNPNFSSPPEDEEELQKNKKNGKEEIDLTKEKKATKNQNLDILVVLKLFGSKDASKLWFMNWLTCLVWIIVFIFFVAW